jgi:hypothetical protein
MARASSSSSSVSSQIHDIVGQFVGQLSALIEHGAVSRARDVILSAFAGGAATALTSGGKRRGRPPGRQPADAVLALGVPVMRKRRKAPIQLCPVPGCTNRAAPVFGMVCSKHKDLPKSEIRKFREARRAQRDKKNGGAVVPPARRPRPALAKTGSKSRRKSVGKPAREARGKAPDTTASKAALKPVAAAS